MYPIKPKGEGVPKSVMSDIEPIIVRCSHCKEKLSSEMFESHECKLQLAGQKTIPVVYFLDTSYSDKKVMTGWGTDGILYTFEVVPRKAIPIVMCRPTPVNMNPDSDDKLPEPERSCPDVEMSIENIPTRCQSKTPFQIVQDFRHKTLDLKWASMFNDFEKFAGIMAEVDDVHIQGMLQDGDMIPSAGSLNYAYALKQIVRRGYSGLFTVELEGKADYGDVLDYFVKLRKQLA